MGIMCTYIDPLRSSQKCKGVRKNSLFNSISFEVSADAPFDLLKRQTVMWWCFFISFEKSVLWRRVRNVYTRILDKY